VPTAKTTILSLLLSAFTCTFGIAADDVQIFRSGRSTLSVYSYGGLEPARIYPELRDDTRIRRRGTAPLTDVVSIPPLATSATPTLSTPKSVKTSATPSTVAPKPMKTSTNAMALPSDPSVTAAPTSRTVTLAWQPSPDESVVGYHVYTGDKSGNYDSKTALGNQTSIEITVDQSTVYVAVSAYNEDGLDSMLSNEVKVSADNSDTGSSGGSLTINSSSQ
jgi:hypothetical protein